MTDHKTHDVQTAANEPCGPLCGNTICVECQTQEQALREACAIRVAGLGKIVERLRQTGDPDDFAAGAFLLSALDDISNYVDCLRELANV